MSLITAAEAQAFGVGLALSLTDLQSLIDREEAEIVRLFGANVSAAPITETTRGGGCSLYLKRAISAVTSITEYLYPGDTAPSTLATTDYYIWGEEGRIERIATAGRWGGVVTVQYTPVDDTDLRKAVLLELVRLGSGEPTEGSVSGLSFSISANAGGGSSSNKRAAQYARLGWLSR